MLRSERVFALNVGRLDRDRRAYLRPEGAYHAFGLKSEFLDGPFGVELEVICAIAPQIPESADTAADLSAAIEFLLEGNANVLIRVNVDVFVVEVGAALQENVVV